MSDSFPQADRTSLKPKEQGTLEQFMELFLLPYIKKRQSEGTMPKPLQLKAARVIFFPDGRDYLVQVNEEVGVVLLKYKDGVNKDVGEPVYEHEVDWSHIPGLPEEYKDCGHITLIVVNGVMYLSFDAVYNKGVNQKLIATARQFYDTAAYALSKKQWSSFIDNLFSAAELAAKCIVLSSLIPDRKILDDHNLIQEGFTKFGKNGNVQKDLTKAFHKLRNERVPARYLKGKDDMYTMNETEAKTLYERVGLLIMETEKYIK
jgi:hypothetical protein